MSLILNGTDGVTFNDASLQGAAASPFGLKNRIINGDMRIDQRNAGASVTPTNGQYTLDRWRAGATLSSKFSVQQSSTAPTGFVNSLLVTSLAATTPTGTNNYSIQQFIEGYNTSDLEWGTANAKTVTLSFWVRSSLTGTFSGALSNDGLDRAYPFSYTISTANTWTQISVTIAGNTSGTWLTTNGAGIRLFIDLGSGGDRQGTAGAWASADYRAVTGATSLVATSGATLYITGVQLEVGSTATPFERRLYNQELANCQRYCPVFTMGSSALNDVYRGFAATTTLSDYSLALPVTPRVPPTGITTSGTFGVGNGAAGANTTALVFQAGGYSTLNVRATTTAGSPTLSQGVGTAFYGSSSGIIICNGCEL